MQKATGFRLVASKTRLVDEISGRPSNRQCNKNAALHVDKRQFY